MTPETVSLAQLGMNDEGPIAMIEAAAAAGFKAVGLPLRSGALRPLRTEIVGDPGMVRGIRAACVATGVGVFDVEALVLGHEPSPDALRETFETAAELGASRVSCLGFEPACGPGAMRPGAEAERFARLAEAAAEFGLLVGIEFMAFRSISSLGAAASLLTESGAPNGRIVLDALHFQRTGATVEEVAALPPGLVSHLQICDAPAVAPFPEALAEEARGARLLPGDGVIPLRALIDALPEGTPMSLEIPVADLLPLPVAERARRGAATLAAL
jgi:sugar phosphate isomerase/epimerase